MRNMFVVFNFVLRCKDEIIFLKLPNLFLKYFISTKKYMKINAILYVKTTEKIVKKYCSILFSLSLKKII